MLEELIKSADKLCASLEEAANNEKMFCSDICLELERYSWDVYKMTNHIRELEYTYGEVKCR